MSNQISRARKTAFAMMLVGTLVVAVCLAMTKPWYMALSITMMNLGLIGILMPKSVKENQGEFRPTNRSIRRRHRPF